MVEKDNIATYGTRPVTALKFFDDVIAMSALMTTTMTYQRDVIEYLKERGLRDKYIVLVGGGPVNKEWAEQIGADGTSDSAVGAVELTKRLISEKKGGR